MGSRYSDRSFAPRERDRALGNRLTQGRLDDVEKLRRGLVTRPALAGTGSAFPALILEGIDQRQCERLRKGVRGVRGVAGVQGEGARIQ
jgi:hypothetical protein